MTFQYFVPFSVDDTSILLLVRVLLLFKGTAGFASSPASENYCINDYIKSIITNDDKSYSMGSSRKQAFLSTIT